MYRNIPLSIFYDVVRLSIPTLASAYGKGIDKPVVFRVIARLYLICSKLVVNCLFLCP